MSTHPETVTVQVPDGYTAVEYRVPKIGDTYLRPCGRVRENLQVNYDTDSYLILKKAHRAPELVYVPAINNIHSQPYFELADHHNWTPVQLLSSGKHLINNTPFDAIIVENNVGNTWIAFGHWNDGIEEN